MLGWGTKHGSVALSSLIILASLASAPALASGTDRLPAPVEQASADRAVAAAQWMPGASPREVVRLAAEAGGASPASAPDLGISLQGHPIPAELRPGLAVLIEGLAEASALMPGQADRSTATLSQTAGAGVRVLEAIDQARPLLEDASVQRLAATGPADGSCASGDVVLEIPHPIESACQLVVGGPGETVYEEDTIVSVDLGGADRYENNAGGAHPVGLPLVAVIPGVLPARLGFAWDLGTADDVYIADQDTLGPTQGASLGGIGVLVDDGGDDTYNSTQAGTSQGATVAGLGLLVDLGGDDRYASRGGSQGSSQALPGLALLLDRGGHDRYSAAHDRAQGVGEAADVGANPGVGALVDQGSGADEYLAEGDHAQGAGVNGGIGLLVDGGGADTYQAQAWAQGAAERGRVGLLLDAGGADSYTAERACQGYGTFGGAGLLVDGDGEDAYTCPSPPTYARGNDGAWHHFTGGFLPGVGAGMDTGAS